MKRLLLAILSSSLFFASQAQRVINNFSLPALSPIPESVAGVEKVRFDLNGEWQFYKKGTTDRHPVHVPGEWEMQGFTIHESETAVYETKLHIPADWIGKQIKIKFDGVSSHGVVKVNGKPVGEHEGSFVPFEVDLSAVAKAGENDLQVEVQALTISDILACTSQYAVHTVGGILRNVTMYVLPATTISNQFVTTRFDKEYKNATVDVKYNLINTAQVASGIRVVSALLDKNGNKYTSASVAAQPHTIEQVYSFNVKQPEQWNPEHPYLYTLVTQLYSGTQLLQTSRQKIGFRQVEVKGNVLLVNGAPVKLHGVNRHSVYPLTGRSITGELDIRDAQLFREANCNYIRTSHYPPSEAFLQACDSLGLFVESESSLCWIQHGASPVWKKWNYTDEKYLPFMVQANVDKMVAQFNHPSILIWSLANESKWSPLFEKVNAIVKKLDPSRPTTFHDQCWGGFNNAHSTADIAVYHYPGINGAAACDTMNRPVLFGEYAHISCYSRRELLTDPGVREAYGKPLVQMYDSMYAHTACLGGAIWSGIDDIFHMPDGRIVGYGPWGIIDAWRRPKPEYTGTRKAYAPIVVISDVNKPVIEGGKLKLTIENRYDFTNMKDVGIRYIVDGDPGSATANILPHGKGDLYIPVNKDAKEVVVTFTDPRGFAVNEERIVLQNADEAATFAGNVALSSSENEATISVRQGNIHYLISKHTGVILSIAKDEKEIVLQGPVVGIIPMNDDDGGKPNVAGETYQNNIYPLKDYPLYTLFADSMQVHTTAKDIEITMKVKYTVANGKQVYHFRDNGTFSISYELDKYTGEDTLPRQYGVILQLPKMFDKLTWKRKGDFSMYPAYDIGRNDGDAMLNAKHVKDVEEWGVVPAGEWRSDANDLGSNDFRSTKKNIYKASLADNNGDGIEVISDGTQAVRSRLQDGGIQLLVADYSNNGSEQFYGSPHSEGRVKIKNKVLKGSVTFRIK